MNRIRQVLFAGIFAFIAAFVAGAPNEYSNYPATLSGGAPCASCVAPPELSWKTFVPESANEPGEPLEISGTIFQADGKTPAEGIVLFVYHTDVTGYYNEQDDPSHPRLRGWMKTGADGKYQFRTIKPAPYPHRTVPAHIHAHLYGPGYLEYSIDDYWFEGDPFINGTVFDVYRKQGSTPVVVRLTRDNDGIWHGTRDLTLRSNRK